IISDINFNNYDIESNERTSIEEETSIELFGQEQLMDHLKYKHKNLVHVEKETCKNTIQNYKKSCSPNIVHSNVILKDIAQRKGQIVSHGIVINEDHIGIFSIGKMTFTLGFEFLIFIFLLLFFFLI
ncbi:hypothetical protein TorRG33x02_224970, partial [Trema orientale]